MQQDDKSLNRQSIEQFARFTLKKVATHLDLTAPIYFPFYKCHCNKCEGSTGNTNHLRNTLLGLITAYNLQLHRLSIHVNGPDLEVNSDGGDIALCVCVILGKRNMQIVYSK